MAGEGQQKMKNSSDSKKGHSSEEENLPPPIPRPGLPRHFGAKKFILFTEVSLVPAPVYVGH